LTKKVFLPIIIASGSVLLKIHSPLAQLVERVAVNSPKANWLRVLAQRISNY